MVSHGARTFSTSRRTTAQYAAALAEGPVEGGNTSAAWNSCGSSRALGLSQSVASGMATRDDVLQDQGGRGI